MELGSDEAVDTRKQEEEEEEKEHFHVLAVDDSVVDMKLLEKLLTVSSCKGIPYRLIYITLHNSFFHYFSMFWVSLIWFN